MLRDVPMPPREAQRLSYLRDQATLIDAPWLPRRPMAVEAWRLIVELQEWPT